jgi:hypothetical protein
MTITERFADRILGICRAARTLALVDNLEYQPDVHELMRLLRNPV